MKKFLKFYVPQVILVVLSVVLGLYLNEWRADLAEQRRAKKLVSYLKNEIIENKEIIDKIIPYHEATISRLDSCQSDPNFIKKFVQDLSALSEIAPKGILRKMPSSNAWKTAMMSQALSNVGYERLKHLSTVYEQQNATFGPVKEMEKLFFDSNFNSKEKAKQNLGVIQRLLSEMLGREKDLQFYYNKALKEI